MSDQGWNTQGTPPPDPNTGASWNQPNPPPAPQQPWGQQAPPPPSGDQWGQQPPAGGQQWGQQPPPPQGQPWGQPASPEQQWGQQSPQNPQQGQWGPGPGGPQSGGGLEPNIGAMLSYLLFGWVGGLIMYFTQKHPEVRFHAAQSVLLFAPLSLIQLVLQSLVFGLGSLVVVGFISGLVWLFSVVMWIFMSTQGYTLKHLKLPVIGDIAEQWAAKPT